MNFITFTRNYTQPIHKHDTVMATEMEQDGEQSTHYYKIPYHTWLMYSIVDECVMCDKHKGTLITSADWDDIRAGKVTWQKVLVESSTAKFLCSHCVRPSCPVCGESKITELLSATKIWLPRDNGHEFVELWEKMVVCRTCCRTALKLYRNMTHVILEHPDWQIQLRHRHPGNFVGESGPYIDGALRPADVPTWREIRQLCFPLAELHCERCY